MAEKVTKREPSSPEYKTLADKRRALASLVQKINESAEHTVITYADKVPDTFCLRRPCGIMQLDLDIGGGFPAGCQVKISGPEGVGKTMLLNYFYAMHQKIYGEEAFICHFFTESYPDLWFMRKCGVAVPIPDQMIEERERERTARGLPKYTKEERLKFKQKVGEFVVAGGMPGEALLQEVLRLTKSNMFGIIGIDSITRVAPEGELSKDLDEDSKMAAKAALKNKFFDQYHHIVTQLDEPNYTTLLMIGQARANMTAQQYERKWKPAEDWSGRHGYQISVLVYDGQNIYRKVSGKNIIVGKHLCWDIEKGKAGTHDNIRGEVEQFYTEPNDPRPPIDIIQSMLTPGFRFSIFRESKGLINIYKATGEELATGLQGTDALLELLRNDTKFEMMVRHEILAAAGRPCLYKL
jgi:RecA/RadA recombinase